MKIGILQDNFFPEGKGGAALVAQNLALGLKERGYDVFVVTSTKKNDRLEEKDGLRTYYLKTKDFGFFKYYLCLYNHQIVGRVEEILKREKPDIVHAHNLNTALSYYCLKIAKKYASKVFLTAHDTMLLTYGKLATKGYLENFDLKIKIIDQIKQAGKQYNPWRNVLIRYYLKNVNKIFAISKVLKNFLEANGLKNVELIYNGINLQEFEIKDEEIIDFKKKYNLINKKIIFWGGRLSQPKGGHQVLSALKIISQKKDNIVLLVAGVGEFYEEFFLSFAKQLGVDKNILFLGNVDHEKMKDIYSASDVILYPSIYFDPFGLINIEAMACKKPVVGTCYGGTPEIVLDGETGYIVNPFDASLMAQKIIELFNNEEQAKQFGLNGLERVKKVFTLELQIRKTLDYYKLL
ncbi:MAG: Glycosyl transferase group 1 [Candidatus Magasanikbacteria bacterium GW2011_GWC2_40_17]|uniref:Glycosyl transferase group 1 n=1 Tax=Candidatus Magasanikbacteria bacterium GW2011_GWA2_42_32 TaxID=1619039 RepID=A0A0G1A8Z4_9BACT|nr:MAG: Glycosyl transferase group 1 [Candidatus Magasanikbacteria bacterium GW2011_GWC2_40_17]KKS57409.1 MAG: Glycosyl transferase group 1 [Candidatus Magasanikbacteria bacterium GW2011_GWA2_42_32]